MAHKLWENKIWFLMEYKPDGSGVDYREVASFTFRKECDEALRQIVGVFSRRQLEIWPLRVYSSWLASAEDGFGVGTYG